MKIHAWASLALVSGLISIPVAHAIGSGSVVSTPDPVLRPTQRFHVEVPSVPLRAMALMASDVALVRIEGSRNVFPEAGVATTAYHATQLSSLKGLQRSQLEIHVGGARDASRWVLVEGAPTFAPGEEVLVFLWTEPDTGVTGVLGLERGVYRVEQGDGGERLVSGDHAQAEALDGFLDRTAEAWLEALEIQQAQAQEGK